MKYSIEIGKIVEGALKHDIPKVVSYTQQLINKLHEDAEPRMANKLSKIISGHAEHSLESMDMSGNVNIPVDSESRTMLADIVHPENNDKEIILSQGNSDQLNSFILNYKFADKLNSMGVGFSRTILLYGPPGCGKTQCAYYIAKKLNLPLVIARLDSLISSYLGTTAKNIRMLFDFIQKMPCVLFLDEFDAIAKARDDNNELGELKRVVNSLLQNVDAMSDGSLLIAATNHDKMLDNAVWRRFEYRLAIGLPNVSEVIRLICLFTKNAPQLSEEDVKLLAAAMVGLSGADVEEIIKKTIRNSVVFNQSLSCELYFNELFDFLHIIPENCTGKRRNDQIKASYLYTHDPKIFSYSRIAQLLNVSKSHVSKLISEAKKDG